MAEVNNLWLWLGHGLDIHWQVFSDTSQVLLRTLRTRCCSKRDTVPAVLEHMVWWEREPGSNDWMIMEIRAVKDKRRGSVRVFNKETWPRLEGQGGIPKWWLNWYLCEEGQGEGTGRREKGSGSRRSICKGSVGGASLNLRSWKKGLKLGRVTGYDVHKVVRVDLWLGSVSQCIITSESRSKADFGLSVWSGLGLNQHISTNYGQH